MADIDYASLAKQFGGSATVDYDALAKAHGGAAVNQETPAKPEATPTEAIAGHPATRFALGSASNVLGAAQLMANLPTPFNPLGSANPINALTAARINDQLKQIEQMKQRGMAAAGNEGFDVAGLAGSVLSPATLGIGKILPTAANLGRRIAQGAGTGAVLGATAPVTQDGNFAEQKAIQTGAGAIGGAILQPLISAFGGAAGKVWDFLTGKYGELKAAQIVRQVAGGDLNAIRAATAQSPSNLTATQAASGINNDVFNALGELARNNDKTSYFSRLFAKQKQNDLDVVRRIAGGANQTEARQVAQSSKDTLNAITGPMRETELGAANIAGTTGRQLQNEADILRQGAANSVQDVRRLSGAQQAAEDLAQSGRMRLDGVAPPTPGLPRISGRYSYGTDLANRAETAAQGSAADSLLLGEAGSFAQRRADSLADYGLRPLNTGKIVASLESKINDPSIGANSTNSRVLSNVADLIKEWTQKGNGVIDAKALYEIRKSAINNEVEKLLAGADPKSQSKRAAELLAQVRPQIDKAIEDAGGTGWRQYLNTFEMGMNKINQQKLGARALEMLETSPKKFERLITGNDPKTVKKIFDSEFDINAVMGGNMPALQGVAGNIARDRAIKEGATAGEGALTNILKENASIFRIPNFLNPKIAVANRALSVAESKINQKTLNALYDGMRDGTSLNRLLDVIPTNERIKILNMLSTSANSPIAHVAPTNALLTLLQQGQ